MQLRQYVRHWLFASAPLLAVLAVTALASHGVAGPDDFFRIHRDAHPALRGWMRFFSNWGNWLFYPVFIWYLFNGLWNDNTDRKRFAFWFAAVQFTIAVALTNLVKISTGAPRPGVEGLGLPFSLDARYHSLPSGHTVEITGAASALALRLGLPWFSLLMGGVVAVMGFSRIYLGWHHVADVFFGWLLGSVTGFSVNILSSEDEHAS